MLKPAVATWFALNLRLDSRYSSLNPLQIDFLVHLHSLVPQIRMALSKIYCVKNQIPREAASFHRLNLFRALSWTTKKICVKN